VNHRPQLSRTETLHPASDAICNATAALSVFQEYDIDDQRHSSSDGQRIETQIPTINARYSSKYFGLKKSVSAYTLVLNHVPIPRGAVKTAHLRALENRTQVGGHFKTARLKGLR
jgi:hypothetical protein